MKNETDATAEYNYKEGEKYKQKKKQYTKDTNSYTKTEKKHK